MHAQLMRTVSERTLLCIHACQQGRLIELVVMAAGCIASLAVWTYRSHLLADSIGRRINKGSIEHHDRRMGWPCHEHAVSPAGCITRSKHTTLPCPCFLPCKPSFVRHGLQNSHSMRSLWGLLCLEQACSVYSDLNSPQGLCSGLRRKRRGLICQPLQDGTGPCRWIVVCLRLVLAAIIALACRQLLQG